MNKKLKLSYDDITIVPEKISNIRHRDECNCLINGSYPIFTAPMDGVIDIDSMDNFTNQLINVVIPRTVSLKKRLKLLLSSYAKEKVFVAFSLSEVETMFINEIIPDLNDDLILKLRSSFNSDLMDGSYRICIDIANGHMSDLLKTIKDIKDTFGNKVTIMSGNIANPQTYIEYENAGCDFVRCNIGTGSRCTTSSNTSVHYGNFSLIKEIYEIKESIRGNCKIIADGGIKGYGDVQKALIYADYVMIGGLFNKAIDSAGTPVYGRFYFHLWGYKILNPFKTLLYYGKKVKPKHFKKVLKLIKANKVDVWKEFYGMSSKKAQSKMDFKTKLKTSEGKVQPQKVEYTIKQWVENERDFLRSAMSYTNSKDLEQYKDSNWIQLTYKNYNK